MALAISIFLRNEIIALALAEPEREVCGLLLGQGERVERLLPCRNVAAEPATRFEIDPSALIAAHRAARNGGAAVIGHYHSHPSGRAEPSPRDAVDAVPDSSIWIIVADGQVTAWRAVERGTLHARFDRLAVAEDGCAGSGDRPQGGDAPFPR